MRGAFIRTLVKLAEKDERIFLFTGDLGYMAVEPFAERFPDRFLNVGVAEQNMVGMGTGLAEAGFVPFLYSIAPFAVLRPYEFIRNGPIKHGLPVRIVGVGGGFEYGPAGFTHHGIEDVGVMRIHPNMAVIAPADHRQTTSALEATWDLPGPVYYRIGKNDQAQVPGLNGRFELGRAQMIGAGEDVLLVAMGSIAGEVVRASDMLQKRGIACTVMIIACFNPDPVADMIAALSAFRIALTVEAHYIAGGVGSLVSEIVAEHGLGCRVVRCGVTCGTHGISGSASYLHDVHRLSSQALIDTVLTAIARPHDALPGHVDHSARSQPGRSHSNGCQGVSKSALQTARAI